MNTDCNDLFGNRKNYLFIKNLFVSENFPHTILLEGVKGCGKFAFSKAIAKTIVCDNIKYKLKYGESCGECISCRKAEKDVHSDISIMQAENAKSIHIDQVREYIDNMYLSPNDSEKKVCIIKDADRLTVQAQNALLKSLEEPPLFLHFILTAQRCDLLLETILSRSIILSVDNSVENERKELLTDITFFEKNKSLFMAYIESMCGDKSENFLKLIYNREFNREDLLLFYSYLEIIIRDIKIISVYGCNSYEDIKKHLIFFKHDTRHFELKNMENTIKSTSENKITKIYQKIIKYKSELEYNANARLNLVNFLTEKPF